MNEKDINRLMMQFKLMLQKANRDHINPEVEALSIEGMKPIVDLVARSRARYLKHVYQLCKKYQASDAFPSEDELQKLKSLRSCFLDLTDGAQSFEISIQRGYLDLKP